jgi:hypothetical protein
LRNAIGGAYHVDATTGLVDVVGHASLEPHAPVVEEEEERDPFNLERLKQRRRLTLNEWFSS